MYLSSPLPRLVDEVSAENAAASRWADLDLDLDFRPPVAAIARARRPPSVGFRMKPSVQPRTRFTSAFSPPPPPKSLSESCLFLSRGIDHRCCVSSRASKAPELGA